MPQLSDDETRKLVEKLQSEPEIVQGKAWNPVSPVVNALGASWNYLKSMPKVLTTTVAESKDESKERKKKKNRYTHSFVPQDVRASHPPAEFEQLEHEVQWYRTHWQALNAMFQTLQSQNARQQQIIIALRQVRPC
jgi:hypothetical protein